MDNSISVYIYRLFKYYAEHVNSLVLNNGLDFTVRIVKQDGLHLTRYLSGNPLVRFVLVWIKRESLLLRKLKLKRDI